MPIVFDVSSCQLSMHGPLVIFGSRVAAISVKDFMPISARLSSMLQGCVVFEPMSELSILVHALENKMWSRGNADWTQKPSATDHEKT